MDRINKQAQKCIQITYRNGFISKKNRNKYGSFDNVWTCVRDSHCRSDLFQRSRQKKGNDMGAIAVSIFVSVVAVVGYIYFSYQDRKDKGTNS